MNSRCAGAGFSAERGVGQVVWLGTFHGERHTELGNPGGYEGTETVVSGY
jgi:hypothetical protein